MESESAGYKHERSAKMSEIGTGSETKTRIMTELMKELSEADLKSTYMIKANVDGWDITISHSPDPGEIYSITHDGG